MQRELRVGLGGVRISKRGDWKVSGKGRGLERKWGLSEGKSSEMGLRVGRGLVSKTSRGHTLLDEFHGLLPLFQAELVPLLRLVQIVHRYDRGRHADHVLLSAARRGHNKVLQPLPINGVFHHLSHRGPCSQEVGQRSSNETHYGMGRVGAPRFVTEIYLTSRGQRVRDSWGLAVGD